MEKESYRLRVKKAWKEAWSFPKFRWQAIITIVVVLSFTVVFNWFFDFAESRQGNHLGDFILDNIPAKNVSWIVFFFLYSGIIFGLYYHMSHPKTVLIMFQTYALVTLLRICTITLLPLEPPPGYLPLHEPFVQLFTNGGRIISKDLFFSGHMSTILSLFFASHRNYVRSFLLFCSLMIGAMVLIQHVHYTIDVIFAVPATWITFIICRKFLGGRTY